MNILNIIKLFVKVDDFLKTDEKKPKSLQIYQKAKTRTPELSDSEIMTIIIYFHESGSKNFKEYYKNTILYCLKSYFPKAVSYTRFLELQNRVFAYMYDFFISISKNKASLYNYIDSTRVKVCHNKRIPNHKVFQGLAKRGKSTMGWFFGFKLHLIINDTGEIVDVVLTSGNKNDAKAVELMKSPLFGFLFGDKGYISKKNEEIFAERGVKYVTYKKKKMKNRRNDFYKYVGLKKRSVIESVNSILKEQLSLEHTRHRSVAGFFRHILSTLISYQLREKKPKITWDFPFLERKEVLLLTE